MHVCSPVTSPLLPHDRPVSFQDVSRVGGPDRNSGAATHSGSRGSVMQHHPDCHPFRVYTKEPSSHRTLGILPAMAPSHSAWLPRTTFGLTLKVLSHRPKWGWMQRKASHTAINAKMLRMKFGARSWKSMP